MILRCLVLSPLVLVAGCGSGPDSAAPEQSPAAAPESAARSAAPAAPAVAAIAPARVANACPWKPAEVGAALGVAIDSAAPETMGTMLGCTYKGNSASLRLNMIVHDPVYFVQATAMTRKTRPGDKTDIPGDPDKAWWQTGDGPGTALHYYRQNVEVEVIPLGMGGDPARLKPLLLKLPRVP